MTVQDDMEWKFIELMPEGGTVDAYVASFVRLKKFAPILTAEEKDRARTFQQSFSLRYRST